MVKGNILDCLDTESIQTFIGRWDDETRIILDSFIDLTALYELNKSYLICKNPKYDLTNKELLKSVFMNAPCVRNVIKEEPIVTFQAMDHAFWDDDDLDAFLDFANEFNSLVMLIQKRLKNKL